MKLRTVQLKVLNFQKMDESDEQSESESESENGRANNTRTVSPVSYSCGRSLPFIQHSQGKFVLCPEACQLLCANNNPVSVVCVAGPYRSGKSFLLNALAGRSESSRASTRNEKDVSPTTPLFEIGNTISSCTRGIWLCCNGRREGSTTVYLDSEVNRFET